MLCMKRYISIFVIFLILVGYFYLVPPKCNKYDIDLDTPELMKTFLVRFEVPINIENNDERLIKKGCPGIIQDTNKVIITSNNNIKKLDDHLFVVLKHVHTKCHSPFDLDCFEDVPGDQYLLQDISDGTKYIVGSIFLGFVSGNYKKINAGYYDKVDTNKRLGDVEVRDWICVSDTDCKVF